MATFLKIIRISVATFVLFSILKYLHVFVLSALLYFTSGQTSFIELLNSSTVEPSFYFVYLMLSLAFFGFTLVQLLKVKPPIDSTSFLNYFYNVTQIQKGSPYVFLNSSMTILEIFVILSALSYGAGYIYGTFFC